jgi:ribosomal protein S18 acetylase RimI-like enzyme
MSVQLRLETADDEVFLQTLIARTITLELGADRWPEPMRTQLLTTQYQNRRMGPRAGFPGGESYVIQSDAVSAGWIFFVRTDAELHIVEIMVLPELRRQGIGAEAIRQVIAMAAGSPVKLTVNVLNARAVRLYERLGFHKVGGNEVQHEMEARTDG